MGKLTKRKDGRYEQSVRIDGKRVTFYGRTQAEVARKMVEYRESKELGELFATVADEWEESHEKKVAYNTMKPYRPAVARAKERYKGRYIASIKIQELQAFIQSVADSGKSQKTVYHQLMVLRMIFRKAILDGALQDDPTTYLTVPRGLPKNRRQLPSDEDIKAVIASHDKPFGLFAYLILYSGLRKGEALALTYQDIDRVGRTITVNKSIYFVGNAPKVKPPKTQAGTRVVPLLDLLLDVLPPYDVGIVFPSKRGGHMLASEYQDNWEDYARDTKISCTAHQLRHAFATTLFEAEISEKDAQDILGHSDISTTRNIYTHIRDSRRTVTSDKLNAYLNTSDLRHDSKNA